MKKHYFTFTAIRRIIYLLIILSSFILQFIILPRAALPFSVLLLIPAGIAVSMHEKEFAGMLWGLLTGVLWDMASPHTDGLMAVIFTALFLLTGLLTRYTLRNTLQTALILTGLSSFIPPAISLLFSADNITAAELPDIFTKEALPQVITALILTVPAYFIINSISKRFHRERS